MRAVAVFTAVLSLWGCATAPVRPAAAPPPAEAAPVAQEPARPTEEAFAEAFGKPSDGLYVPNVRADEDALAVRQAAAREAARAEAEQALAAGKPAQTLARVDAARADLSAEELPAWLELEVKARWAARDAAGALTAGRAWLDACGGGEVHACRLEALAFLRAMGAPAAELDALDDEEACLFAAEGEVEPLERPCLAQAREQARARGDLLSVARAALVQARSVLSKKGPAQEALVAAETACAQPRCLTVRREALRLSSALLLRRGDVVGAAKAALQESRLVAQAGSASRRRHLATAEAERLCAQLERRRGQGCPELEKGLFGERSYRDFSREETKAPFLPAPVLRRVMAHYGDTLQPCADAALSSGERERLEFTLRWTVRADGRVVRLDVAEPALNEGPLGACLREAASLWRYPRFESDVQQVEQRFTLRRRVGEPLAPPAVSVVKR